MSPRAVASLRSFVLALACGCSAQTPAPAPLDSSQDAPTEVAEPEPEAAPEPARPNCDDGGCLSCGDSMCPLGAYCQKQDDKSSCAWLDDCAGKPSCKCVLAALGSGCTCSDSALGATVECSSP